MISRISILSAAAILVVAAALVAYIAVTPRLTPTALEAGGAPLTSAQAPTDNTGGVTVSGMAKVRVKPNIAMASIGVEITTATLAEATSQANTKTAAVIEKLKSMGVADKDIQTINYSINPITQPPKQGSTPSISGYRVNNQLSVTIRKIDDAGKILDAAVAAGANNIYGVSFSVDDPTPYQQQARTAAIKDAQDKAAQLAKAAGVTLGKVISINEGGFVQPRQLGVAAAPYGLGGGVEVPVQTGELEITVAVDMRFALQ